MNKEEQIAQAIENNKKSWDDLYGDRKWNKPIPQPTRRKKV